MQIRENQKLSEYTTIGIGGPVPAVYLPETEDELAELIRKFTAEKRPYRILGKGSNIVADDRGLPEVVICTRQMQRVFEANGNLVTVDAGYPMAQLAYQTASRGLSGLEFAVGIPGSIGGVTRMNAGAHKKSISEVVHSVRIVTQGGKISTMTHQDLNFNYRYSAVPSDAIITAVTLELLKGDAKEIHERIRRFNDQRTASQPLREKSAGCIFRNPGVSPAGKLIEDSGLKGTGIGGAVVSEIHANFIVNKNQASFEDVVKLIDHVKQVVYEKHGVRLEEEVIIWRAD
ncbi:MAG TPA: UDP-N-acetylmuramate dehydrogenase [Acidobacteriota bacterium]|nr:UDP-N-acetylmuramate dehydrogenase [Acidobacteriota bacterium]